MASILRAVSLTNDDIYAHGANFARWKGKLQADDVYAHEIDFAKSEQHDGNIWEHPGAESDDCCAHGDIQVLKAATVTHSAAPPGSGEV